MNAQRTVATDELSANELLDPDTSAAILRWMETGDVPQGIDPLHWERWADAGCRGDLIVAGAPVTSAMLGRWGRTGVLR